ncbi:hypothetical protein R1sor_010518 [Riccia sorocarpa]|uniref:Uncharacterized protein n=1 Tax=Riccia sorocarpa TaxID=122646 RepID=A0ABD3I107_9MARC
MHDDSNGKSAVISGAEERTWKRFTYRTDMIDAYLSAVTTEGGLFTRLAFCGERFDRARLDRFYLSNRGEWSSQKRWELAWGRVKQILKAQKQKNREEDRDGQDIRRLIHDLRVRSEDEELSTDEIATLRSNEEQVKQLDLREAKGWKCRSKERWLQEGEVPSRYFYSQLKAKYAREKITALHTTRGDTTTSHKEIIQEVEAYYKAVH